MAQFESNSNLSSGYESELWVTLLWILLDPEPDSLKFRASIKANNDG